MITLRNVAPDGNDDHRRVKAFLAANPDPGVRARPDTILHAALKSGQALVMESSNSVIAFSAVYKFAIGNPPEVFSEIGTMRVTMNGLGLQTLLVNFHLAQLSREEDINSDPGVFAIVAVGSASEHNLRKVGMQPWHVPPGLADARRASGVPLRTDKLVLAAAKRVSDGALGELARLKNGDMDFATPKGESIVTAQLGWLTPSLLPGGP